jgi:phosphoribosyl 1,2-cyclic phosphodiesterase
MALRFACLGSGSKGNAWIVESGDTRVMVDCGFSAREIVRRLARLGLAAEAIDALLITHEHGDHARGAAAFAEQARCPVYLSHGSQVMLEAGNEAPLNTRIVEGSQPFAVDALEIRPFPVPHDAREPLQFVFSDGAARFALLTDAGHVTPHMASMLEHCDGLALECNHDLDLLARGRYTAALKRRISGPYGHLDNAAGAALLKQVDSGRLQHVVAAHLSQENNRPDLARAALSGALGCGEDWIAVADQDDGLDWRQL